MMSKLVENKVFVSECFYDKMKEFSNFDRLMNELNCSNFKQTFLSVTDVERLVYEKVKCNFDLSQLQEVDDVDIDSNRFSEPYVLLTESEVKFIDLVLKTITRKTNYHSERRARPLHVIEDHTADGLKTVDLDVDLLDSILMESNLKDDFRDYCYNLFDAYKKLMLIKHLL